MLLRKGRRFSGKAGVGVHAVMRVITHHSFEFIPNEARGLIPSAGGVALPPLCSSARAVAYPAKPGWVYTP